MNEISSFYDQTDLRYTEIAICLETTAGPTGKFAIPILTPLVSTDYADDNIEYNRNTKTLLSGSKKELEVSNCNTSNYSILRLPDIVLHEINYHNPKMVVNKGEKFVAVFVGGDVNKCVLISRYKE